MDSGLVSLHNKRCTLTIDLFGGAIVDFHLDDTGINPLNFQFTHSDSHHEDVHYKGHFLCLPRWGDPSNQELKARYNKHGDFVRLKWKAEVNGSTINMLATSTLEQMAVERKVELDEDASCFRVIEKIRNEANTKRAFQMVQHPTIAAPFLTEEAIVNCNASRGFDYAFSKYDQTIMGHWPRIVTRDDQFVKLDIPDRPYSSVFSFIVNREDEYGWITAYSPLYNTLLGYVWKREDYPWINHWIHWEETRNSSLSVQNLFSYKLKYRGLEFGTSGVHKPFDEIIKKDITTLLGESTINYLGVGEEQERAFIGFMQIVPSGFKGVQELNVHNQSISIFEKETGVETSIHHSLNAAHGVQK
jgi:hypothetical protein